MSEKKPLRTLCFGDSLTEGYTNYGLVYTPYSGTLKTVLRWELDGKRGLESWGGDGEAGKEGREQGRTDVEEGEGKEEMGGGEADVDVDEGQSGNAKEGSGKERWKIEVVTEGVSGEMVQNMRGRMEGIYSKFNEPAPPKNGGAGPSTPTSPTFATPSKPYHLVIFLGGTNDLGRGRLAPDILKDIKAILDIPLATGAKVLLMTVPECRVRVGWLDDRRDAVNSGLREWADGRDDMEIFDLCEAIPYHTMKEEDRKHIWDDGLHFTEAGYEMIGTLVGNRIVEILGEKPGWLG